MKLGCASWGFRELDLEEYFRIAAALGLEYLEVECFNEEEAPRHIPSDFTPEDMIRLQAKAKEKNVEIVSFAGGNDFTVTDKAAIANDIARIKRMIDLAKVGKVEVIRVFAGWIEEKKAGETTYAQVINALKETGRYALKKGVILALENHGGITSDPEQIKKILDGVNLPSVRLNYDPANFHHCKNDPVRALGYLKNYISYVHLKDSKFEDEIHKFKAVGEGKIDWLPIIDWLNTSFNGYAMIEYENPADVVDGTERSLSFLKQDN